MGFDNFLTFKPYSLIVGVFCGRPSKNKLNASHLMDREQETRGKENGKD